MRPSQAADVIWGKQGIWFIDPTGPSFMRRRRHTTAFHPDLERFEAKRLLSAGASAGHVVPAGDQTRDWTSTRP